jgi:hypothetical protein
VIWSRHINKKCHDQNLFRILMNFFISYLIVQFPFSQVAGSVFRLLTNIPHC